MLWSLGQTYLNVQWNPQKVYFWQFFAMKQISEIKKNLSFHLHLNFFPFNSLFRFLNEVGSWRLFAQKINFKTHFLLLQKSVFAFFIAFIWATSAPSLTWTLACSDPTDGSLKLNGNVPAFPDTCSAYCPIDRPEADTHLALLLRKVFYLP